MLSAVMPNGACNLFVVLVRIEEWKEQKSASKEGRKIKKEAAGVANALS